MNPQAIVLLLLAVLVAGAGRAEDAGAPTMVETYSSASMDLDVLDQTLIDGGPQIRLALMPVLSGRAEGCPPEIARTEASTEVVVNERQTVSLASATGHPHFLSRFLVAMEGGRETPALEVELTPRRVGVDGR
jgi:hypothetical protein